MTEGQHLNSQAGLEAGASLSIRETCEPREDLLKGTFKTEIFTASLNLVIEHHRGKRGAISNLYTDPKAFFEEETNPTQGLRSIPRRLPR